ncbi:MAG: methyltransferase domain-containing protein [Flavobacteriaceae bacterium]
MKLKKAIKKTWISVLAKRILYKKPKNNTFPGSENYWENRYKSNDNSGAGSYGRLAEFKAEVLNNFVLSNNIKSVIEFGSGDGNQLTLSSYRHYKGFDVSETAINRCLEKFAKDKTKQFYMMGDKTQQDTKADLILSLDVLYHLIEDKVFNKYMKRVFKASNNYVIIYSSNYDNHFAPHVKCRKFTNWIEKNVSNDWELKKYIKNKYPFDENRPDTTSMADFYIYQRK